MATYKSVREADCENPIVLKFLSYEVQPFSIWLADDGAPPFVKLSYNIQTNGTHTEIVENVFAYQNFTTHEDNTFEGHKVIIEQEESKSGYIRNGVFINERPKTSSKSPDKIIYLDVDGYDIVTGHMIYFLTDSPSTDDVFNSALGTFEARKQEAYDIITFVLGEENGTCLLLDIDDTSMSLLELAHEVTKDYSKANTIEFQKTCRGETTTEYKDFTLDESDEIGYQLCYQRFVFTNNGRKLTMSYLNESTRRWDIFKTFLFDVPKITGKTRLMIEFDDGHSMLHDIMTNF